MKELLIRLLKEAGSIQIKKFNHPNRFEQKGSISSIVTEVDLMCDRKIIESIRNTFPMHNILSEENGLISNNSEYTWVIDPLDGTSNFAAGLPWFGVLIAVFENNLPFMAGAYLPVEDKLYFAESGKGAYLNNEKMDIKDALLKNSLFAFSTDYSEDEKQIKRGLDLYRFLSRNTRNIRSTNSLVDFMLVAEGKLGGVVNMFTKIWDSSAPMLIIKEAGGDLKLLDFSEPEFDLSKEAIYKNYPVIAGSVPILKEFEEKNEN